MKSIEAIAGQRIYASLELSKSTWVVALQLPTDDKISIFRVDGGDIERLIAMLERAREQVGGSAEVCTCYEAGYDGFWIHRVLNARGIQNHVLDSASIQVNRRGRRVKTDRTDAESLVRVLMAIYRGDHQVARVVEVPSIEEEDNKRLLRSRNNLLRETIRHANRIRGLLFLQGIRHIDPSRQDWANALVKLQSATGAPMPSQLMREIRREGKLLETAKQLLKDVEAEISGMIRSLKKRKHPAQRGLNHPIATRLSSIKGLGPQAAGILATEVFYRKFSNRRQVASYIGLTPTPYNSGTMIRDQGISKAGNRRARTIAIELAWVWVRTQPDSALARWFHVRVGDAAGRIRRITIVALARKLMVALWRFLEDGVVPDGAVTKA
jgi:transposase